MGPGTHERGEDGDEDGRDCHPEARLHLRGTRGKPIPSSPKPRQKKAMLAINADNAVFPRADSAKHRFRTASDDYNSIRVVDRGYVMRNQS